MCLCDSCVCCFPDIFGTRDDAAHQTQSTMSIRSFRTTPTYGDCLLSPPPHRHASHSPQHWGHRGGFIIVCVVKESGETVSTRLSRVSTTMDGRSWYELIKRRWASSTLWYQTRKASSSIRGTASPWWSYLDWFFSYMLELLVTKRNVCSAWEVDRVLHRDAPRHQNVVHWGGRRSSPSHRAEEEKASRYRLWQVDKRGDFFSRRRIGLPSSSYAR